MKKQTSEIEEIPPKYPDGYIMKGEDGNLYMLFDKNWWSIQEGHSFDIQYILQDEKKKWKEEVMDKIEGEFGIAHTSNAPMLSDGSGEYESIVFMPLKEWKELRVKLEEV